MMISLAVTDESQIAQARRESTEIAKRHGFGEVDGGRVALVATELCTNLIKHGRGGELLAGAYEENGRSGIQLIALDQGPGMANVQACLADGYSSAGTPGHGLGAVTRQSEVVDIATWLGVGTAVLARVSAVKGKTESAASFPTFGAVCV